ncbi:MAG: PKD domain-containing protein [Bacteroidales bacterium]|nr:PKD domain-containing protein [Bacteroidales bacterium]
MKRIFIIWIVSVFVLQVLDAQTYGVFKNEDLSNLSEDQLAPVPYVHNGDTGIVYMSNITIPGTSRSRHQYGSPMDLYFYDQTDKKGMKNPRLLDPGKKFFTIGDDGPATFSGDFSRVCLVQPQEGADGEPLANGNGGLFFAEWANGEWSEPIPFTHNDPGVNFSTPCLSKDGQILFFAAEGDLEGALGGMDIYYTMEMNGSWSAPVNLGGRINTPEHEIFPYYFQSEGALSTNLRLYFSSKGHDARGGTFDLFYSEFYEGEWLEPLPVPSLNSARFDELGIFVNEQLTEGMFSRRDGDQFNIYNFRSIVADYESFPAAERMKVAPLCYRIYESSMDTIDPVVFEYEWVINDTLRLPGHEVKYCFPGPGYYSMSFNVTNKLTDTIIYSAAQVDLTIPEYQQPIITAPDTAIAGEPVYFSAAESNLPADWDSYEYFWDFGDLSPQSKGEIVSHTYKRRGEYPVVLGVRKVLSRSEERMVRNGDIQESEYKIATIKDIIVLQE